MTKIYQIQGHDYEDDEIPYDRLYHNLEDAKAAAVDHIHGFLMDDQYDVVFAQVGSGMPSIWYWENAFDGVVSYEVVIRERTVR